MEDKRMSGRTTRLIDNYIQLFFENPKGSTIVVKDHYPSNDAHRTLMDKIVKRLKLEHPGVKIETDVRSHTIKRM